MTDRLTKALLPAIALGLWANAVLPLIRPTVAKADSADIESHLSDIAYNTSSTINELIGIDGHLKDIRDDLRDIDSVLRGVGNVRCRNPKICAGWPAAPPAQGTKGAK